jgi:hypothetical protein
MGLKFDVDKDKSIAMVVETSGIEDPSKLDFTFSITVNDIKYGFPCELKEGKVTICIPALKDVVKSLKVGKYKASLDVTGDKNYFLQPFNEEVELTMEPKVGVIVDDETKQDMTEAITASISKIIDIDEPKVEESSDNDISNSEDSKDESNIKSVVNKMFE